MKLLLDTHIWIWAAYYPEKLGRSVRRELQKVQNELYLSPISIWETRHLARRGKVRFKYGFSQWVEDALSRTAVMEAAFTFAVGAAAAGINLPESDPGDVFLAATASVYDFTLVTADHQFFACSWLKTLAND